MIQDRPERIGGYRIDRVIGRSTLGIVHAAHDPTDGRTVAIKLIRADLLAEAERDDFVARFLREAERASRCVHPGIVHPIAAGVVSGNPFVAMELVVGGSLADTLGRRRFPASDAAAIAIAVLDALAHAHQHGIVHGALRSTKILRPPDGGIAVTGFGITRPAAGAAPQEGAMLGTLNHLSPEQCRGEAVDARSDLFAVGAFLYEMLSGEKPFAGRGMSHVMARLLAEDPADLAIVVPGLPLALAPIVHRALAKSPERRFPSAEAMATALRAAVPDARAAAPGPGVTASAGLDPREVGRITDDLARHLGPIARILVRHALPDAASPAELRRKLAINLGSEADRAAFAEGSTQG